MDISRLLRTKQIPGTADIKITKGDVKARSEFCKAFNHRKPLNGIPFQRVQGWSDQVAVRFPVATSHSSAQLVEIRQSEHICPVDNDGIRIRNIQTGTDNRSGNQHINLFLHEIHHYFFQLLRR